jgi:hypothetical protein
MPRVSKSFRRATRDRLLRVAHAGTVFLDGEAFRQAFFDPKQGAVCAEEPDREDPQYHVDHGKFIALKKTLFKLKRLEFGPTALMTWRPYLDDQVVVAVAMDLHPVMVRPGTQPINQAMRRALAGETVEQEYQFRARPVLSVLAPIRDSFEDVVGVLEVYAPLVPEKKEGHIFGGPAAQTIAGD